MTTKNLSIDLSTHEALRLVSALASRVDVITDLMPHAPSKESTDIFLGEIAAAEVLADRLRSLIRGDA